MKAGVTRSGQLGGKRAGCVYLRAGVTRSGQLGGKRTRVCLPEGRSHKVWPVGREEDQCEANTNDQDTSQLHVIKLHTIVQDVIH